MVKCVNCDVGLSKLNPMRCHSYCGALHEPCQRRRGISVNNNNIISG